MNRTWVVASLTAACALVPGVGAGQKLPALLNPAESKRPSLADAADTNDWEAYFDFGVSRLRTDPRNAERAFYWASRLDPSRAEPLYGRWVAYWMRFPGWFEEYVEERPSVLESPNVKQVDSLYERALFRNPLMPRTLTVLLYDQLPGTWGTDRYTSAVLAYGAGRFDAAAEGFAKLIRDDPVKRYRVRYELALCFTALQRYDSATAEVTALLDEMRRRDEKQLAHSYQSKELLEYSVALLQLARANSAAARAALQRALLENLAFYPAHATLADLALGDRDPAGAWREYGQAVELAADDPVVRWRFGAALARAGRADEAEVQLRKAVELEPLFAAPYFTLGTVLEARGDTARALAQYRDYVQRAPRSAPERVRAEQRVLALAAAHPDSARRP